MKKPFYIEHEELINAGFTHERIFDRDGHNDPFDNLKIDIYKKPIVSELILEVVFGYFSEEPFQWRHINSTVELVVSSGSIPLKIETVGEVHLVFKTLSEILNNSTEKPSNCSE